ncbi:hypothetical protein AVEN_153017-1 [Araneus ventricosus]|uniref:Uncharacterized protein n=1 Tax=Araneus ventricosus TaxID=182803 RepID=A0A4Y2ADP1_ARAVE|nr:hypothetical protein AVEN_153017-1 [Araneus ventricosus]
MLKIEAVKCIFVWFATPKIVTRHNAEEKRKRHTPEHPLSWHSVSVTVREDPGQVSKSTFGTHSSNKPSGLKCAMEEIKQESDEDSALISSCLILAKKHILFPTNCRRDLKSFKDLIETERKWKYRKKTAKFQ